MAAVRRDPAADPLMVTGGVTGVRFASTRSPGRTSDVRWTERYWYTAHPKSCELIFDAGLGYYPNCNVMDGFAGVTIGTNSYTFGEPVGGTGLHWAQEQVPFTATSNLTTVTFSDLTLD